MDGETEDDEGLDTSFGKEDDQNESQADAAAMEDQWMKALDDDPREEATTPPLPLLSIWPRWPVVDSASLMSRKGIQDTPSNL